MTAKNQLVATVACPKLPMRFTPTAGAGSVMPTRPTLQKTCTRHTYLQNPPQVPSGSTEGIVLGAFEMLLLALTVILCVCFPPLWMLAVLPVIGFMLVGLAALHDYIYH